MSDQSLRDALAKLCDRYDRIAEEVSIRSGVKATYDIPGSEIRHLLAAHPAEPAVSVVEGDTLLLGGNLAAWVAVEPVGVSDEGRASGLIDCGGTGHEFEAEVADCLTCGGVGVSDEATSLGLTRPQIRDEVDELIRNDYAEGWREAKQRPEIEPPALEIDWTQPGGVRITELWCVCDVQGSALSASCKVHGGAE